MRFAEAWVMWKWRLIALAVILALVLAVLSRCSKPDDKKIERDLVRSENVVAVHKAETAASSKVDTVVRVIYKERRRLEGVSDSIGRVADTAAHGALTLADSSSMWHLRWTLRGFQIDTLKTALRQSDERADSLVVDRLRWKSVADSAVSINKDLARDVEKLRSGCRILWVKCPSRKAAFLSGAAAYPAYKLTVATINYLKAHHPSVEVQR